MALARSFLNSSGCASATTSSGVMGGSSVTSTTTGVN
jgi:hypothetical protein